MGTNYYLKGKPACEHCGRPADGPTGLHIGKSSAGWAFSLHVYPNGADDGAPLPIRELRDWMPLFLSYGIVDEYGADVLVVEMVDEITKRRWRGPEGLSRHKPEPHRCLGPGEGTYDLMIGEFS